MLISEFSNDVTNSYNTFYQLNIGLVWRCAYTRLFPQVDTEAALNTEFTLLDANVCTDLEM